MTRRILFLVRLPCIFSVVLPAMSWAACTSENGWNNKNVTFNFPSQIVVQADAPVGSIFYDNTIDFDSVQEKFASCNGSYTSGTRYANGWQTDSNGIAATNVAGVGIRIYFSQLPDNWVVPKAPINTYSQPAGFYWMATFKNRWRIQLVKTGAISGGTLQGGGYASFGIGSILITTLNNGGGGAIIPTGCSVTTPDISVPLGQRKKSDFTGPGSVTPWQDFNIELNCNKSARINVRIDATPDTSYGSQGVMQLDKASGDMAATGVGIQIGYRPDASLVQFGQEKYYWTSPSGGYENVQLRARYYQTSQTITAGKANGTATFTLTYK